MTLKPWCLVVLGVLCCGFAHAADLITFADGKTWSSEIHVATNGNNTSGMNRPKTVMR